MSTLPPAESASNSLSSSRAVEQPCRSGHRPVIDPTFGWRAAVRGSDGRRTAQEQWHTHGSQSRATLASLPLRRTRRSDAADRAAGSRYHSLNPEPAYTGGAQVPHRRDADAPRRGQDARTPPQLAISHLQLAILAPYNGPIGDAPPFDRRSDQHGRSIVIRVESKR